uniref:uncharacterized protein LOC100179252 isoform X1 n=1 Tax=Ciona intestinalis TaxID=7719 RepID=UPI000EF51FCC|nr:uncharacterized protein LOC100179252 isoform X1 [Ciona intestinalis]|eukprot:XP_026691779.1 uncharacterized protein LOC100179252 isoform X1 [Ciona intestinalis]
MANVFTKRSKMPRTTTLSDYGFRSKVEQAKAKENMEEMRLHSPTRRQNPQPIGLVYQSPYNRHNHVFGIWNPNQLMPVLRCGVTLPHLQSTNFSCAHHPDMLANYMIPANQGAPIQRKQPEVHYTRNTIQRQCFQWPPNIPEKFKGMVQSTRFGHSHRAPVSQTPCRAHTRLCVPTQKKHAAAPMSTKQRRNAHACFPGPKTSSNSLPVSLPVLKQGVRLPPFSHTSCADKVTVYI